MDKHRDINVIFMSGETGLGKTTFAKKYCEKTNSSYCISSSSNDPLQDYKGEDILILDDLRDDSFSYSDFLKLLDNHTRSSTKSRYHNKPFIGDTIIVTSSKPLKDWYKDIKNESKNQLYRRIKCMYDFIDDWIYIYEYNERVSSYVPIGKAENVITLEDRRNKAKATKIFKDLGITIHKIHRADDEIINPVAEPITIEDDITQKNIHDYFPENNESKIGIFK